jgi:magnesium chelatase subunit I
LMEFALHGLAEYSQLSKKILTKGLHFADLFSSMFSGGSETNEDDEDEDEEGFGNYTRKK